MPSSANYVRDYKQEQKTAKKRGEDKDKIKRNKARQRAIAAGQASVGDGKDIGHKKSLKSGGSNSKSNTKVQSIASNRSAGGKSGNRAGKAAGGRKGKRTA